MTTVTEDMFTQVLAEIGGAPEFAAAFFKALHLTRAAEQDEKGEYPGMPLYCKVAEVLDHLAGRKVFAFSVVTAKKASFLALDVDEAFPQRLPIIRAVLEAKGLEKAAFITDGSDPGRGKVVITLSKVMFQHSAVALVKSILEECTKDEAFGDPSDITAFPKKFSGGICRIAGCNPKRNGDLEGMYTIYGEPLTSFEQLTPYEVPFETMPITNPSLPYWIGELRARGFYRTRPHDEIRGVICKAAFRYLTHYGNHSQAVAAFTDCLEEIRHNSPSIKKGETTKYELLDPAQASYYIDNAVPLRTQITEWTPITLSPIFSRRGNCKGYQLNANAPVVHLGAMRIYQILVQWSKTKVVSRNNIKIDLATLADIAGFTKMQIHNDLKKAAAQGLVSVVEQGTPHTRDADGNSIKGNASTYAIHSMEEYHTTTI